MYNINLYIDSYHFGLPLDFTRGVRPHLKRFLLLERFTILKITRCNIMSNHNELMDNKLSVFAITWSSLTLSTVKLNQNL